jgi:hypothetical protein
MTLGCPTIDNKGRDTWLTMVGTFCQRQKEGPNYGGGVESDGGLSGGLGG